MTKHTTPEYRNWVSFAHGLINVFCKRLRPFVTRETVHFYSKVSAAVAAYHGGPCTCTFVPRRRPNQYHDMRTCTWANFLQGHHHRNIPNWKQSDSTKWTDPIQGPWEIAKLFLPDLGGHAVMSAEDMDLTGILNLMYWCDHFRPIPQPLIKDLRDIRNRVWGHVTKLELTNAEKATAFGAIEALLQHPSLAHDRDAQKALHEIQLLKTVTDVDNFQAQVLKQFKEMIEEDILGLKSDSTQNREDLQQLEERLCIVENLEIVRNTNQRAGNTLGNFAKSGARLLCDNLILCTQRISECMLAPWLVMILLFNFSVTPLDPISYIEGCPLEVGAVPFDTKEFNFTSHLNKARESFTGRIWLSHQLESLLTGSQGNNIGGVLIIGAPGTGKSAFSAQLICSSAFNPYITRRIIGYHLCRHSDVATQEPGRFVRNIKF